jgi:hypothetical protein
VNVFITSSYGAAAMLGAVCLAMNACAQVPAASAANTAPRSEGPASGIHRIEQIIGPATCSNDGECRIIGVGALACGGPEAYRAWSVVRTDAAALEQAVALDSAARRAELEREGMRSTCAVRPVPGVACVPQSVAASTGRCVLLPANSATR